MREHEKEPDEREPDQPDGEELDERDDDDEDTDEPGSGVQSHRPGLVGRDTDSPDDLDNDVEPDDARA